MPTSEETARIHPKIKIPHTARKAAAHAYACLHQQEESRPATDQEVCLQTPFRFLRPAGTDYSPGEPQRTDEMATVPKVDKWRGRRGRDVDEFPYRRVSGHCLREGERCVPVHSLVRGGLTAGRGLTRGLHPLLVAGRLEQRAHSVHHSGAPPGEETAWGGDRELTLGLSDYIHGL